MQLATIWLCVNCSLVFADLKMGVFPRRSVSATTEAFKPLADYLSVQLGEKVELVVPNSFKNFWMAVKNKEFDIVHYNQYHYIKSHKELGYQVFAANEEFGNRQIAGSLSVRKDSGINSVSDLRGRVILFGGGYKAMGSYIAPTAILKKAGLVANKDYKINFAQNPPGTVIGVFNNSAGAAGAGNVVIRLNVTTQNINADEMKILAESEPFTQLPWAVNSKMSEKKVKQIQKLMTTLKDSENGKAILTAARVTDFYAVSDDDFTKVREITQFALDEKY